MVYLIILLFGLGAFIIVFLYQQIFTHPMALWERILFFFILTGIIVTSAYIRLQYIESGTIEAKVLKPIASPIEKSIQVVDTMSESKDLERAILPIIEKEKGKYSIVIKNLKTGGHYTVGEDEVYSSASLYKLWTIGTVFQQIQDGKLTMDKVASADIAMLNKAFDIEENAELKEGTITKTIEDALEQMITVSHNYSAILLTYTVKNSTVKKFLSDNQLTNSKTGAPPTTTPSDIAEYFEKLYKGQLVSSEASSKMLEILKRQKINDRIPKYLPESTVIAHKTGELFGVKHDAGIVFSEKGDYIIVLMSDTASEAHAAEVEAKISKVVWEHFEK